MSVKADIAASISGSLTRTSDLATPAAPFALEFSGKLKPGTLNNQADLVYADTGTIAASGNVSIDLAGALTGPFGTAVVFVEIVAIMVKAAAENTNNVIVGGATLNAFLGPFGDATDTVAVGPGQVFLITAPAAGWPVTAGTGDLLRLANSAGGTGVNYDIVIVGRSA